MRKKAKKMGGGAIFTPLYLGSGWMDFFGTHIKMTVRTYTLNLSRSHSCQINKKSPKNRFFKKWALFPQVTINIDL